MSLKKSIVIDDRHCICKKCDKSNLCPIYTKYQKMLDLMENIEPDKYLVKITAHIRKCNQFDKEREI